MVEHIGGFKSASDEASCQFLAHLVISISLDAAPFCLQHFLKNLGIRAELDDRNEKLGYRIREAQLSKVPYMVVVGEDELNNRTVTVRARVEGEGGKFTIDEFIAKLQHEIETKKH